MATHAWCLPVSVLLAVLAAVNSTDSLTQNRVYTQKDVYKVKERIEVICNITSRNVDIRNVLFKKYQSAYNVTNYLKPTKVLQEAVKLVIPSSTIQNGGTYRCVEQRRHNGYDVLTIIPKTVCVLDEVVEPTSLKCVNYYNQNKLVCSWDTDQITYWKLEYKVADVDENFTVCKQTELRPNLRHASSCQYYPEGQCNDNRNNSCILWLGDAGFTYDRTYVFRLTGCNRIGARTWKYKQDVGQSIVKLDPVTKLKAHPHKRHIQVSWDSFYPPSVWENGLQCIVYYYNKRLNTTNTEFLHFKQKDDNVTMTYDIKYLIPYTSYTISVCCTLSGSAYWSDNTTIYTTTLQDVPLAGPDFVPNGFSYYSCHGSKTCLALYWQDLDVISSQGDVINYTIMLNSSSGQSYLFHNVSSQVQSVYLDFPVDERSVYDVYGWTLNAQGISVSYSYMRIPTRNKAPLCIEHDFQRNTNTYKLWYSGFDDGSIPGNVTYYWCQGIVERPLKVQCRSDLNWRQTTNASLLIPANPAAVNFAVSINGEGDSTGIIWNQCKDTNRNTGPPYMIIVATTTGGTAGILIFLGLVVMFGQKCYRKYKEFDPEIDPPKITQSTTPWSTQDRMTNIAPNAMPENVSTHNDGDQSNYLGNDGSNTNVKSVIGGDIMKQQIHKSDSSSKYMDFSEEGCEAKTLLSKLDEGDLKVTGDNMINDRDEIQLLKFTSSQCNEKSGTKTSPTPDNIPISSFLSPSVPRSFENDGQNENTCSSINSLLLESRMRSQSKDSSNESFASDNEFEKRSLLARNNATDGPSIRGFIEECQTYRGNLSIHWSETRDEKEKQSSGYIKADDIINPCVNEHIYSPTLKDSMKTEQGIKEIHALSGKNPPSGYEKNNRLPVSNIYVFNEEITSRCQHDNNISFDPTANEYQHNINDTNLDQQRHILTWNNRQTDANILKPTTNAVVQACQSGDVNRDEKQKPPNLPNQLGSCTEKGNKHFEINNKEIGDCPGVMKTPTDKSASYSTKDDLAVSGLSSKEHIPNTLDYIQHDNVLLTDSCDTGNTTNSNQITQGQKRTHGDLSYDCTSVSVDIGSPHSVKTTYANQKTQGQNGTRGDPLHDCTPLDIGYSDKNVDETIELQIFKHGDRFNDDYEYQLNGNMENEPYSAEKFDGQIIQKGRSKAKSTDAGTNAQLEMTDACPLDAGTNVQFADGYPTVVDNTASGDSSSGRDISLPDNDERSSANSEIGYYVKVHTSKPDLSVCLSEEQIPPLVYNSETTSSHDGTYNGDKMSEKSPCEITSETRDECTDLCKIDPLHENRNRPKTKFKISDDSVNINGYVTADMLNKTDDKIVPDSVLTPQFLNDFAQVKTEVHGTQKHKTETNGPKEDASHAKEQEKIARYDQKLEKQNTSMGTHNTVSEKGIRTKNKGENELPEGYTKVTFNKKL